LLVSEDQREVRAWLDNYGFVALWRNFFAGCTDGDPQRTEDEHAKKFEDHQRHFLAVLSLKLLRAFLNGLDKDAVDVNRPGYQSIIKLISNCMLTKHLLTAIKAKLYKSLLT